MNKSISNPSILFLKNYKIFRFNNNSFSGWTAFGLLLALFFLTACSSSRRKAVRQEKLTNQIILDFISQITNHNQKNLIFVDSILKYRNTFIDAFWFEDADSMVAEFKTPAWNNTKYTLTIPDNVIKKIKYINDISNMEKGGDTYCFFSPLLPTTENGIFAMQRYVISDVVDSDIRMRLATRETIFYKVRRNHIQIMEDRYLLEGPISVPVH